MAPVGVGSSSAARIVATTTGLSAMSVTSSSAVRTIGPVTTSGLSSMSFDSSGGDTTSIARTTGFALFSVAGAGYSALVTTGLAQIGVATTSSASSVFAYTRGLASIGVTAVGMTFQPIDLVGYVGEPHDVLVHINATGKLSVDHPEPVPPIDFDGLVDPIAAPMLAKSHTSLSGLTAGTYRYSYAAWKGTEAQVTAPSPTATITLTTENTVTITYPTTPDADGYLVYREQIA